jgi:hypothetical protein
MGFYPDMRRVQSYMPERHVSSYMFSATFPPQVVRLADQFLKDQGFLNLSSDHIHVTEVEHVFYAVPGMDKERSLIRIIEVENPPSALIFCNTRARGLRHHHPAALRLATPTACHPTWPRRREKVMAAHGAASCVSWWLPTWRRVASTCPSCRTSSSTSRPKTPSRTSTAPGAPGGRAAAVPPYPW